MEVRYHGTPTTFLSKASPGEVGWFHAEDGTINGITEPDGASVWFPNNHPRDKAIYPLDIRVPNPWMVAATGRAGVSEADQKASGNTVRAAERSLVLMFY